MFGVKHLFFLCRERARYMSSKEGKCDKTTVSGIVHGSCIVGDRGRQQNSGQNANKGDDRSGGRGK